MDETVTTSPRLGVPVGDHDESAILTEEGGQRSAHPNPPPFVMSSPDMRIIYLAPIITLLMGLAGLALAQECIQSIDRAIHSPQYMHGPHTPIDLDLARHQRYHLHLLRNRFDAQVALAVFAVQIATTVAGVGGMYFRRAAGYLVYILGMVAATVAYVAFAMLKLRGLQVLNVHGIWMVAIGCNVMLLYPVVMEWYDLAGAKVPVEETMGQKRCEGVSGDLEKGGM